MPGRNPEELGRDEALGHLRIGMATGYCVPGVFGIEHCPPEQFEFGVGGRDRSEFTQAEGVGQPPSRVDRQYQGPVSGAG